jgi:hypothetical protein
MKLDFVVPGFSKCGTTTLCSLLCEHPDIFIPAIKEPNFFAWEYDKGWDWYERHFDEANSQQLWGDGSTSNLSASLAELSCQRITQTFPGARFIFIARNPVKRLESSFREFHHSGHEYGVLVSDDINETLRSVPNMIADSQYWSLINIYRDRVPDDRIHVLFLEDFTRDPVRELEKCFAFLGVNEEFRIPELDRQLNAGTTKYRDSKTLRLIRHHHFANRCLSLLGIHQDDWLRRLGLRKRFTLPIEWTPETRRWLHETLGDEIRSFLRFYGKPEEFWGFEAWASDCQSDDRTAA